MRKLALASFTIALAVLAGCSSPEPAPEAQPDVLSVVATKIAPKPNGAAKPEIYVEARFIAGHAASFKETETRPDARLLQSPAFFARAGEPTEIVIGDEQMSLQKGPGKKPDAVTSIRNGFAVDVVGKDAAPGKLALELSAYRVTDGKVVRRVTQQLVVDDGAEVVLPFEAIAR